jgi:hypothetical protein
MEVLGLGEKCLFPFNTSQPVKSAGLNFRMAANFLVTSSCLKKVGVWMDYNLHRIFT